MTNVFSSKIWKIMNSRRYLRENKPEIMWNEVAAEQAAATKDETHD